MRISYQTQDRISENWLRFGKKKKKLRLLQGFNDSCGWNFRRGFRMREKINGKYFLRSKEKISEGSNGLRRGSIQAVCRVAMEWDCALGLCQSSWTIHRLSVMLGNCGDRMTAQGRGAPPCSSAAKGHVGGRNLQVLGVLRSFQTKALPGGRFVESRRSRGCKQSCWLSPPPFLFFFPTLELSAATYALNS